MMNYNWLILLVLFFACNNESRRVSKDNIIGDWVLYEALRNGKISKTLENTTFSFDANDSMSSNLFIGEQLKYEIDKKTLIQMGSTETIYEIVNLSQDTMTLMTKKGQFNFLLSFAKQKQLPTE